MKKEFKYNFIAGKDLNDRDIQWWDKMEDGTQLMLPITEDDTELIEFISGVKNSGFEDVNYDSISKAIEKVNVKMPNIYLDMGRYVKHKSNLVLVGYNARTNLFCFSSELIDNKIEICWNVCDICGTIARYFRSRPNTERLIMLSKRTHITDLKIEQDEDGDIIITPTIENI